MKELKDLTLKEFEQYAEILKQETVDIFTLMKLFGYDAEKMSIKEFNDTERKIQSFTLPTIGVKKVYDVKGRRFKACLNMSKINAGQFIDFQNYAKTFKLQEVLSVFLIPQTKKLFGYKDNKYNKGYDIFEVQDFLYNNFTIGDANELSNFFLNSSNDLLRVMKAYLVKRDLKQRMRILELKQNKLSHMFGSKQQKTLQK